MENFSAAVCTGVVKEGSLEEVAFELALEEC